jgi:hypothetical protein
MMASRWRQVLRKVLWLVAILALFLISLAGVVSYLYRDEPPPADADLRSYRRAVQDSENGFLAIDLSNEVSWPDDDEHLRTTSESLDLEAARKVIAENEEVLRKLDESLALPDFQVPEFVRWDTAMPYLLEWRSLAYVVCCRARLLFEEGREKEAFAQCLKSIRLGRRVQDAQGIVIHYLVGIAIYEIGVENIAAIARRTRLAPEELKPFIEELGGLTPSRDGLRDAYGAEYCFLSAILDAPEVFELGPYQRLAKNLGQLGVFRRVLFQPNRTRRLLGTDLRGLIEAIPKTHAEAKSIPLKSVYAPSLSDLAPGGGGKMFLGQLVPVLSRCLIGLRTTEFQHAATRTLLALRAFEVANGRLPASLDELVPAHLESVPLDPFDGKPLRYSAEKKLIYSVGEDLVDSGGSTAEETERARSDRAEPTLRIEASPPLAPR